MSENGFMSSMYPGKAKEIAAQLGLNQPIEHFYIDSRFVEPGGCFFALKGERSDGHAHLRQVADNKGVAAIIDQGYDGPDYGLQLIRVSDVLGELQAIAAQVFAKRSCQVVGITGSVSKTSMKEFIAQLLSTQLKVYKSPGSYNSQITCPLSILNCPEEIDVAVLEYAMSEPGNMQRLVQIAPPDIGVMGPIALAHAENFSGLEMIAKEKGHLLTGVKKAFIHKASSRFFEGEVYGDFELPLEQNRDGALKVARYLGVSEENIAKVKALRPAAHRGEIKERLGVTYFDDSYNASVASYEGAFKACPKGKRLIAVLGSMKELGSFSKQCHEQVKEMTNADHILAIGDEWRDVLEKDILCDTFDELKRRLEALKQAGDVVLIKGSNSHQLWRLVP